MHNTRRVIIVIFILFINVGFSQGYKSGKVTYIISKIKERNPQIKEVIDIKIEEMLEEESRKQEFILEFSTKKSSFRLAKKLENTDTGSMEYQLQQIARFRYSRHYNIFVDMESKINIMERNEGVLVKESLNTPNWNITNEEKFIGDYKCYKAIYVKKFIGRDKKEKTKIIESWFCPTLPFSYGPKEYHGLPGLILELTENENTLYAKNIELFETENEIVFPKGRTVTMEEYERKVLLGN
ncbi:MAG: GLPGLI family protein [Flavobacterium sp. JAD_PAG50586_2]|nr:MAG: GLPGLI family protein [Flavobacterium sp. JAD_PAG50586_2]